MKVKYPDDYNFILFSPEISTEFIYVASKQTLMNLVSDYYTKRTLGECKRGLSREINVLTGWITLGNMRDGNSSRYTYSRYLPLILKYLSININENTSFSKIRINEMKFKKRWGKFKIDDIDLKRFKSSDETKEIQLIGDDFRGMNSTIVNRLFRAYELNYLNDRGEKNEQ